MVDEPNWMDDDGVSVLWQAGAGEIASVTLGRDCAWFVKIRRANTLMLLHEGPEGMYETPAGILGWGSLSETQKEDARFASKQDAKRAAETRLGIYRSAPKRVADIPERHPDDPFCEAPSPDDDAGLCKPASEGSIDRRVYLVLRHAYCAEGPRFSLPDDGMIPPADGTECAGWGSPFVPLYAAPLCGGDDTLNPDPNCTDWGNPWEGDFYEVARFHEEDQFTYCAQEILWYPRPHACPAAEDCAGSADLGG